MSVPDGVVNNDENISFDGLNGDIAINIGCEVLKAHKCVLIKCPYFLAAIEGDWIESKSSVISMNGYVTLLFFYLFPSIQADFISFSSIFSATL